MIARRGFLKGMACGAAGALAPRYTWAQANDGFIEIVAMAEQARIGGPGSPPSELWTFSGSVPGPEIRVRKGERVRVRLINRLDEPTSIHWHGIRIDNAMDGVPDLTQKPAGPGERFEYDFVAPDAGTYWYHSHFKSWRQVERGLYGPLIVEGDAGGFDRDHDITLMIDDWRLDRDGAVDVESFGSLMDWSHAGRLGNWLMVNGASRPEFPLRAGEAYRLRLLNAANARILEIDVSGLGARLLGLDGQIFSETVEIDEGRLVLGPAQRADLLVVPENEGEAVLSEVSGREPLTFARFVVAPGANVPALPAFRRNDLPAPSLDDAMAFTLDMTGGAMGMVGDIVYKGRKLDMDDIRETGQVWAFNGVANIADEPIFSVERNRTVVVETRNRTAFPHAMHVHGHHFRLIDQQGDTVEVDGMWRDTFLIMPEGVARIAFVADNPGKWLLHCHMLEHAAAGMSSWFEVR